VLAPLQLRGKRIALGLSGGADSVVLLHVLRGLANRFGYRLSAIHVNHGLSPNAGAWQKFCAALCRDLGIPFKAVKVAVRKRGTGIEAAAREARRAAFMALDVHAIVLAHHLDDQAETVLFNLLRGAGLEGASGMPACGALGEKALLRPLLGSPRGAILAYAAARRLAWIEDESNADEALARNFIRHRVGPLLESRFPRWRESLARAARHFAAAGLDGQRLLRAYLKQQGLRAPSERKLLEMLKQLGSKGKRTAIAHDGFALRTYRGQAFLTATRASPEFEPRAWCVDADLALPALGGELRFRRARGQGIDRSKLQGKVLEVRLRSGGERLQLDRRRPHRTLKNLFQESGVPPWQRERLPLLYCGDDLVWVPGLGVAAKYLSAGRAAGIVPAWHQYA
jgi:tRNA(Ile)-lysidine synthase